MTKAKKNTGISLIALLLAIMFILLSFLSKYLIFLYPLIIVFLTLKKTEDGLAFVIFTLGMDFTGFYDGFIGPLHPNSISVIGMMLFLGIALLKQKKVTVSFPTKIFALFVLYISINLIFSSAKFEGIKMLGKFLVMLLALALFNNYNIKFYKLMKYFTISGAVSIFVFNTIYYFILGNPILIDFSGRVRLFGGAFWATAYPLFMSVCFISSLLMFRKTKKLPYLIFAGLYFAYAIASYTRAVWVALFIVITFYFIYNKAWVKLVATYFIVFFVLANFLVYFMVLGSATVDQKKTTTERFTAGRSDLWEVFYEKYKEKPIFGLGFEYTMANSERLVGIKAIHSDPLRVLFDLGLFGFLLYGIFIIIQTMKLLKIRKKDPYRYIMLFFIFYFIASLTGNIFNYIQLIGFPMFAMLGLAANKKWVKNESTGN